MINEKAPVLMGNLILISKEKDALIIYRIT
jgi:hypothetical protein